MADRHRRDSSRSARLTTWIGPALQGFVNVASAGATILASVDFANLSTIVPLITTA